MFSGKSEVLLGRLHRADIAGVKTHLFKPAIDDRYDGNNTVNSHSGLSRHATPIDCADEILNIVKPRVKVIGIDEAQFFDSQIVAVCEQLVLAGKRVIVAGLSLDFRGEPFGFIPTLIAIADEAVMLKAICKICGEDVPNATRTQRIVNGNPANYHDPLIKIGAKDSYEARCFFHHEVPGKP
jgi:thymidine kinase